MQKFIGVVHLIWIPYGIQLFKNFIDSYKKYSAGYTHELILLFNGIEDEKQAACYHTYIKNLEISYQFFYYKIGHDLEAYHWVANKLSVDYILFVNSYSCFLSDNWLLKFVNAFAQNNTGLVGATGSWESYYTSILTIRSWRISKDITLKANFEKWKLMLKAAFIWRWYFKSFPNPHIRTNSFYIRKNLFLDIKFHTPKTKFDAYCIESGYKSITCQILKKGLQAVIVDKFGKTYKKDQWKESKVFWIEKQENLLISDNQTTIYKNASSSEREKLRFLAWGNP